MSSHCQNIPRSIAEISQCPSCFTGLRIHMFGQGGPSGIPASGEGGCMSQGMAALGAFQTAALLS